MVKACQEIVWPCLARKIWSLWDCSSSDIHSGQFLWSWRLRPAWAAWQEDKIIICCEVHIAKTWNTQNSKMVQHVETKRILQVGSQEYMICADSSSMGYHRHGGMGPTQIALLNLNQSSTPMWLLNLPRYEPLNSGNLETLDRFIVNYSGSIRGTNLHTPFGDSRFHAFCWVLFIVYHFIVASGPNRWSQQI